MDNFFTQIEYVCFSDIGKFCSRNEDSYLCLHSDGVYVVADGLGGGCRGDLASKTVTEVIGEKLKHSCDESPGERIFCLNAAITEAHLAIQKQFFEYDGNFMGSTIAGIMFNPWNSESALVFNAGDSRVYRLRNNKLCQLTFDHTVASEIMFTDKKDILKYKGVLTHAIGIKGKMYVAYSDIKIEPEDLFFICSDGISTYIHDEQITELLASSDIGTIPEKMIQTVYKNNGKDNATAIIIKMPKKLFPSVVQCEIDIAESKYWESKVKTLGDSYGTI